MILGQVLVLFIEKIKKYCYVPVKGTINISTDFCITVQAPNTSLYYSSRAEWNNHTA